MSLCRSAGPLTLLHPRLSGQGGIGELQKLKVQANVEEQNREIVRKGARRAGKPQERGGSPRAQKVNVIAL